MHMRRLQETWNTFQILNLEDIINNNSEQICIPVVATYFGKHKTFIYTVREDRILERWLITPDGEKTNSTVVAETKYVCFLHLQ